MLAYAQAALPLSYPWRTREVELQERVLARHAEGFVADRWLR
jgi:hypothetical protein